MVAGFVKKGDMRRLAEAMRGEYHNIQRLRAQSVREAVDNAAAKTPMP